MLAGWAWFVTMLTLAAGQAAPAGEVVDWPAQFQARLAELRARGEPVTMDDVMAARTPIPDEENSALVFLQAFAAQEAAAFELPSESQAHFGFAREVGARQPEGLLTLVRGSVEADAEALRLIHEGARLTRGAYPITLTPNPFAILMDHLSKLRKAARLCLREAAVRTHEGNGAAAADSLLAIRRLSASLGDSIFLIDALVRMAVDAVLCDGVEKTLGLCELPPEKLEMLRRELATEEDELSLVTAMESERASGTYMFTCSPGELRAAAAEMDMIPPWWSLPAGVRAMDGLRFHDIMGAAVRTAGLTDREKLAGGVQLEEQVHGVPMMFMFTRSITPALGRTLTEEVKGRTLLKVARTALAVEQYRLEHGAWPESLDVLVPGLLEAVPQDPFASGTLGYKREKTRVIVYSVGPNGHYDGGRTRSEAGDTDAYDLAFRLLEPAERGARTAEPEEPPPVPGQAALHAAARSGNRQSVARLLADGADVHARDAEGCTALHLAANAGSREAAELLLDRGADVNATDLQGRTPTGLAVRAGHAELADFLRERGGVE